MWCSSSSFIRVSDESCWKPRPRFGSKRALAAGGARRHPTHHGASIGHQERASCSGAGHRPGCRTHGAATPTFRLPCGRRSSPQRMSNSPCATAPSTQQASVSSPASTGSASRLPIGNCLAKALLDASSARRGAAAVTSRGPHLSQRSKPPLVHRLPGVRSAVRPTIWTFHSPRRAVRGARSSLVSSPSP